MQSYVLHLECSKTGVIYPADQIHNLSDDGMPLLVRYDLKKIKEELSKDSWCVESAPGFWRYQALLPVSNAASRISLGEVIISKEDGLLLCPEGAATAAGYQIAIEKKIINKDEKVVLFNCASGLKYPMPTSNQIINKNLHINYKQFN